MSQKVKTQENGQALVEYVLLLILVGVVAIGALQLLGGGIGNVYEDIVCGLQGSCAGAVVDADTDSDESADETEEEEEEEEPCSTTDTPIFAAQCIGGSVYLTVTSTCEAVSSSSLSIDPDGLLGLDLPIDFTLVKEGSSLTLSSEPILNIGLCVGVDTSTFSVDGTVYYDDGEVFHITVD